MGQLTLGSKISSLRPVTAVKALPTRTHSTQVLIDDLTMLIQSLDLEKQRHANGGAVGCLFAHALYVLEPVLLSSSPPAS